MKLNERIKERIEKSAASSVILNHAFLDDEQLTRNEQIRVLQDIFDQNIREKEIGAIVSHFAPMLRGQNPVHLSLLGKTGTGKTTTTLLLLAHVQQVAREKGIEMRYEHLDLSLPRPCFRAINDLACLLNASKRYLKGISVDEMAGRIEQSLANYDGFLVLFIDEVDHVNRDIDAFLKFLVRRLPQAVPTKIVLVFASNRLDWRRDVDSRVKSFLKVNEIIFQPYNALDLQVVLKTRVDRALKLELIDEGVVEKIAAYASREHGDARKAVELLSRAARIAETEGSRLSQETVDRAYEALEMDSYLEFVKTSPTQLQAALFAVLEALGKPGRYSPAVGIYGTYQRVCQAHCLSPLTQRRFSDLLLELELYGFVGAKNVSLGRYGRKKEITLITPDGVAKRLKATIGMNLRP
ncbi:Cdc6/Cdc18 family protein [Myxococcota bacterium]